MPDPRLVFSDKRKKFATLVPKWIEALNLKDGHVPNSYKALQASFYDWLEARHPGDGGDFLVVFKSPRFWRNLMKEHLGKRVSSRGRRPNERFFIYLNYEVTPESKIAQTLQYTTCDKCGSIVTAVPGLAPQPSDDEIRAALAELKACGVAKKP